MRGIPPSERRFYPELLERRGERRNLAGKPSNAADPVGHTTTPHDCRPRSRCLCRGSRRAREVPPPSIPQMRARSDPASATTDLDRFRQFARTPCPPVATPVALDGRADSRPSRDIFVGDRGGRRRRLRLRYRQCAPGAIPLSLRLPTSMDFASSPATRPRRVPCRSLWTGVPTSRFFVGDRGGRRTCLRLLYRKCAPGAIPRLRLATSIDFARSPATRARRVR